MGNDPRDVVVNDDDPESPRTVVSVREELAAKLLDPNWHPVLFVAGDMAAVRGETTWFIGGQREPVWMAKQLHWLADEVANHVPARRSHNRAERRRIERDGRRGTT